MIGYVRILYEVENNNKMCVCLLFFRLHTTATISHWTGSFFLCPTTPGAVCSKVGGRNHPQNIVRNLSHRRSARENNIMTCLAFVSAQPLSPLSCSFTSSSALSPSRLSSRCAALKGGARRCKATGPTAVASPLERVDPHSIVDTEYDATVPNGNGRYGRFGGQYVPETIMANLDELENRYKEITTDAAFRKEFHDLLRDYVGRPSPLYFAERLTARYARADGSGPQVYLKREDLNHTGAHKINNSLGQVLLAKRLGKTRIIAETGAGQHGVATATVCARFGLKCVVFMGATDMERQSLNVFRMRLLGAEVKPVTSGSGTLTNALSEAIRDWVTYPNETHYIVGSVAGPHPYPMIVRDFQSIIGEELREQAMAKWNGKPDIIVACVGGGSNAMGIFNDWKADRSVRLIGVEASGEGVDTDRHAATLTKGTLGVLHGSMSYLLQDEDGMPSEAHSISAGLDYPSVGPEHSFMKDTGRAEYVYISDDEALDAFKMVCKQEGIIPALETAHAFAHLDKLCPTLEGSPKVVVCLSGRGDKDVTAVVDYLKARGDSDAEGL